MGLLRWLKEKRASGGDSTLREWRQAWMAASAAPDPSSIAALTARLDALQKPEDEIEIEREMLAGLEDLVRLQSAVTAEGLPIVETGHRVVGREPCHFSALASMPDHESQPSGRLIFTNVRAIFAGGARATTVPWHAVSDVMQQERDLVLVRRDRESLHRFRCNAFSDALCGAFLARALATRDRPR